MKVHFLNSIISKSQNTRTRDEIYKIRIPVLSCETDVRKICTSNNTEKILMLDDGFISESVENNSFHIKALVLRKFIMVPNVITGPWQPDPAFDSKGMVYSTCLVTMFSIHFLV